MKTSILQALHMLIIPASITLVIAADYLLSKEFKEKSSRWIKKILGL